MPPPRQTARSTSSTHGPLHRAVRSARQVHLGSPGDKGGNVFAATGDKGVVYKITPDGKGSVFYQTKTTHAISLAFESDGHLLVGTESPGRLFRLDANGKPFVLLDSPTNEIHALR